MKSALAAKTGANIRAARLSRGMSQGALAAAAGITASQTSNIERGKSSPSLETLERIASAFKVRPCELLGDAPPSAAKPAAGGGLPEAADYSFGGVERLVSKIADAPVLIPRPPEAAPSGAERAAHAPVPAASGGRFPEYEISGIETIARGVCIRGGRLLVCRAKGSSTCYLPGGHIEFGETGREALAREMREETRLPAKVLQFMGALENSFMQHGARHAEINLVYRMEIPDGAQVRSAEPWISFEWVPLEGLADAGLLPEGFRALADGAESFSC